KNKAPTSVAFKPDPSAVKSNVKPETPPKVSKMSETVESMAQKINKNPRKTSPKEKPKPAPAPEAVVSTVSTSPQKKAAALAPTDDSMSVAMGPTISTNFYGSELLPNGYNRNSAPKVNGLAVDVNVSVVILTISPDSNSKMEFDVDLFYHLYWTDYRLNRVNDTSDKLILDYEWKSRLWIPDTSFRNAVSGGMANDVISPSLYFIISNTTNVFMASRLRIKFSCDMKFEKYPFDKQICFINITTLSQNINTVRLNWHSFRIGSHVDQPEFGIKEGNKGVCVKNYTDLGNYQFNHNMCSLVSIRYVAFGAKYWQLFNKTVHSVLFNCDHVFHWILDSGKYSAGENTNVFMASRLRIKFSCDMKFEKYPFDKQICFINITTLSQNINTVRLNWHSFRIGSHVDQPEFGIKEGNKGVHSCLYVMLHLERNIGNYLIKRFIPSFLIVIMSFIGFWIPANIAPARISLIITSLLALIAQQIQAELNVSYIYALEVWTIMCITYVFATLIEFSVAISWPFGPSQEPEGNANNKTKPKHIVCTVDH
ncbi:unnamed protein product, partial [Medioppia subpectinata]